MIDRTQKLQARARARSLRQQGLSIKRIARVLAVSPSSVLRWTEGIELTPAQTRALSAAGAGSAQLGRGRKRWAQQCREERLRAQDAGRQRAREGNLLHQAGCLLYWAEGTKGKNAIKFSNSDLAMVRLFCRFLTEK